MTKPTNDVAFAGSIPALYEECLVPVIFRPYAQDLAARAAALAPRRVLEIAAGTGIVTRLLAEALPDAEIFATDLNPDMLAIAETRWSAPNLSFRVADAQDLPFADDSFDLVVIQFGAMFFPDRVSAYAGMRRVLAPGGTLLFNAWDSLAANPGSDVIQRAIAAAVPEPKPSFLPRTPFGYHDMAQIERDLRAAGFGDVAVERVEKTSPPATGALLARGLCLGSPVFGELSLHGDAARDEALAAAIAAAEAAEPDDGFAMSALVAMARG
ncbi:class I SAM-dependent methyltransferase [Croceicoccus sp. BE223]|uniref:class I SAM-dependent methyltransferase n=1 Tax=Croceicoccus sp. BE223 TaxID=2817716 RepID=UPI00285AF8F4|nr:class I SAM-dependent methyltransferase [Croceicoccus sp. BE223]MDR7103048.1 ubiquinone/menaquinone biosynthesis C-methylase UbiE [Croceicoccus sp. BE223]